MSVKGASAQGVSVQRDLCPGGFLSSGVSVRGGFLSREGFCPGRVSVQGWSLSGGLCPEGSLSGRSPDTVTCGWYTSYWNAYLFMKLFIPEPTGMQDFLVGTPTYYYSAQFGKEGRGPKFVDPPLKLKLKKKNG